MEQEINKETPLVKPKTKPKSKGKKYAINLVLILLVTLGYSTYTLWGSFGEVLAALQSPKRKL